MNFKDHPVWTTTLGTVIGGLTLSALSNLFAARWRLAEWLGRPTRWAWDFLWGGITIPRGLVLLLLGAALWAWAARLRRRATAPPISPQERIEKEYRTDHILGADWVWEYPISPRTLAAFCPECGMRLVPDRGPYHGAGVLHLYCENCEEVVAELDGSDWGEATPRILREIERRILTGQWEKSKTGSG